MRQDVLILTFAVLFAMNIDAARFREDRLRGNDGMDAGEWRVRSPGRRDGRS